MSLVANQPRRARWFVLWLAGCGPDETLALLPTGGGGSGGVGGEAACALHEDCAGSMPWCEQPSGRCAACPPGLTQCGGACVDLQQDPSHCSACFEPCSTQEVCSGGICGCTEGTTRCGESCVDTRSDPLHCGMCDHPCEVGQVCDQFGCHSACGAGHTACATGDGVACVDLLSGPRCGSCEVVCGAHEVCVEGACRAFLPASPCEACPCADVCSASFSESVCCVDVHGQPHPACVSGPHCP